MRDHHVLVPGDGAGGGGDDRLEDLAGLELAAREPVADLVAGGAGRRPSAPGGRPRRCDRRPRSAPRAAGRGARWCPGASPRSRRAARRRWSRRASATAATKSGTQSVDSRTWSTQVSPPHAHALGLGDVLGDRPAAVGEGRVDVHVLARSSGRRPVGARGRQLGPRRSGRASSPASMKSSPIIRTMPVGRNSIRPDGIGSPSASLTQSFGMSTPLATVSGIVPGKRGLTSSSAGSPLSGPLDLDVRDPGEADPLGDLPPELLQRLVALGHPADGDSRVDPHAARAGRPRPPHRRVRARTSSEYSGPGRFSWTSIVPSRGRRSRSSRVSISMIPREPLPVRGFTKAGSGVLGRIPDPVGDLAPRHADVALAGLLQAPLVEAEAQRALAREHERRSQRPRTRPRRSRERDQLAVDGRDEHVDPQLGAPLERDLGEPAGSSPRGSIDPPLRLDRVEAGGAGVDVGREQLEALALPRRGCEAGSSRTAHRRP